MKKTLHQMIAHDKIADRHNAKMYRFYTPQSFAKIAKDRITMTFRLQHESLWWSVY